MSLYNALFGRNPLSPLLMAMVGVEPDEVPRFRDAFLFDRTPEELGVAIYTRTGGGNRQCYCRDPWHRDQEEIDALPVGDHFDGCYPAMNRALSLKPTYLSDEDDDFDCTYATFYFRIPKQLQPIARDLRDTLGKQERPADAWDRLLTKLRDPGADRSDEEVANALDVGERIVAPIVDHLRTAGASDA